MDGKYASVLLASVLALTATVLVQVVIVPWVQARTRRIERWETSVVELGSLVEETLPHAVSEFRSAAQTELLYRSLQDDPDYDPVRLRESVLQARNARRQADRTVDQHRRQIKVLANRIARRHRRAPYWRRFRMRELVTDLKLSNVTILMVSDELKSWDDQKWTKAWAEYRVAEEEFAKLVEGLTTTMRPPSRELRKRLVQSTKSWLKAHVGRGRRSAAITCGEKPDTTPAPSS